MTFNEFQRELERRGIDKHNAFMLTLIYEQVGALSHRIDDCASVLVRMAQTMDSLAKLSEDTRERIKQVSRMGRPDGVEVHSVRNDPLEDK